MNYHFNKIGYGANRSTKQYAPYLINLIYVKKAVSSLTGGIELIYLLQI